MLHYVRITFVDSSNSRHSRVKRFKKNLQMGGKMALLLLLTTRKKFVCLSSNTLIVHCTIFPFLSLTVMLRCLGVFYECFHQFITEQV